VAQDLPPHLTMTLRRAVDSVMKNIIHFFIVLCAGLFLFVALCPAACSKKTETSPGVNPEKRDLPDIVRKNLLKEIPDMKFRVNADLGGKVTYLGLDVDADVIMPTKPFTLTHYWKVKDYVDGFKVFTHLSGGKKKGFVNADHDPVNGKFKPDRWAPGDIIRDTHTVTIPGDWKQPHVTIYTGLFKGKKRMKVTGPSGGDNRVKAAVIPVDIFEPRPVPETINAVKTLEPPVIDGKLDEAFWASAVTTDSFVHVQKPGEKSVQIRAKVAWDDANVYLGVMTENTHLNSREAVRVLLDADGDGKDIVEIRVDPGGHVHDASKSNTRVAVHVDGTIDNGKDTDKGWKLEMAVPFKTTHAGETGDLFRMNIFHSRGEKNGGAVSAWSAVPAEGQNDPSLFGFVTLANERLQITGRKKSAYPNVLLISVDTLRRDHLPFYGYEKNTAPFLGSLAQKSVVFDEAVAAHTNTSPSHASMITGLYPSSHGVRRNCDKLRNDVATLAEIMEPYGYQRAAFVSGWTLAAKCCRLKRGFEVYNDKKLPDGHLPAEKTFERTLEWLSEIDRKRPFFLFYHLFDPHFEYKAPDEYARRFLAPGKSSFNYPMSYPNVRRIRKKGPRPGEAQEYISRYDGEILYADHYVGMLLEKLDEMGVMENTMIVFTTDHGETLDERQPFFTHGGRAYDEQLRIPLVIHLPGNAGVKGRRTHDVHHVDIFPTICDFARLAKPSGLPGISLLDIMKNNPKKEPRDLFSHARPEPDHVSGLEEKMVKEGLISVIRRFPYKLIAYPTASGFTWELFNLEKDAGEKENIAAENPVLLKSLDESLQHWRHLTGADVIQPSTTMSEDVKEKLRSLGYMEGDQNPSGKD